VASNKSTAQIRRKESLRSILYDYKWIIISFVLSFLIFFAIRFSGGVFYQVYIADHYLVFHTIIEFAGIIMHAAAFLLVYYVGENNKRLRMKIIATVLLFVALIDFWHTFSYDGMPGLLIDSSAQSATAFWIVGRMGFSIGILASSLTSVDKEVKKTVRLRMTIPPIALAAFFLIYISLFPSYFPTMFVEGQGLTMTKQVLEYVVIGLIMLALVFYLREYHKSRRHSLALFIAALIISIFSELAFTSYASVYDSYNLLGHLYKLVASYMIFKVVFIFNISYPYNELKIAQGEISEYANNLETLVEQRTLEVKKANEEIFKDLEYARSIQKAIMPAKVLDFDAIHFYSEYVPFEKIGGDFFGIEDLNDDYLGFYIGDVAGHGIPAAMMTIFLKQTIISRQIQSNGIDNILAPKVVLKNLYNDYNDTDFPYEMYAVMIYGLIHKKSHKMIFSSGGLNTMPAVIRQNGGVSFIEHRGFPICKYGKDFDPGFTDYTISLAEGDKVLFYTDGIIDAKDGKGRPFGEQRLFDLLEKHRKQTPIEISQALLTVLDGFSKDTERTDDLHYFIMEMK
jgi:sigma-B regulation protein RsbU (phosphoserine phosphatase)